MNDALNASHICTQRVSAIDWSDGYGAWHIARIHSRAHLNARTHTHTCAPIAHTFIHKGMLASWHIVPCIAHALPFL